MKKVAVLIPCYNEEKTIGTVIEDFNKYLPYAKIYVYDNNSTDNTYKIASSYKNVIVKKEKKRGKGNVIKKMFKDIKADIYLLVDGDNTYHAKDAQKLIDGINNGYDMIIGDRLSCDYFKVNTRKLHGFGNKVITFIINLFYHSNITDSLSGFRALSKEFVNKLNIESNNFEIETEICIKAIRGLYKIGEVPITYTDRIEGSVSKLNTIKDGFKILKFILKFK